MSQTTSNHPVSDMRSRSIKLREQTLFAARQAQTGTTRAQKAGSDIAALDLEGMFHQLHQLVAIVGGKSRHTKEQAKTSIKTQKTTSTPPPPRLMAAE